LAPSSLGRSFEVIRHKKAIAGDESFPRSWELQDGSGIYADSSTAVLGNDKLPQREVSAVVEVDASCTYTIVVHPNQKGREGKFNLRFFSDCDLVVEQVPETNSLYLPGSWDKVSDRDTAGGSLKVFDEKGKDKGKWVSNPKWCQNPQFLLSCANEKPGDPKFVELKLVCRRTDSGKTSKKSGRASREESRKSSAQATEKLISIGMVLCKAPMSDQDAKLASQRRKKADANTNALGQRLPTKESSLLNRRKIEEAREEEKNNDPANNSNNSSSNNNNNNNEEDMYEGEDDVGELMPLGGPKGGAKGTTSSAAKKETSNAKVGQFPDRKINVEKKEWSVSSNYSLPDVATLFLKIDRATLSDGLLVIPSMSEKNQKGSFTLEVHSDYMIKADELPESRSKTVSGEWGEGSNGGCHLHPTWARNPIYLLSLGSTERCRVKISLSRSEKAWKNNCRKDGVGNMIGFYLMVGKTPNRGGGEIIHEGRSWNESPFVIHHSISTPDNFYLDPLGDETYAIMPTTFEPEKDGNFFLSVVTEADFTLKSGGSKDKS